MPQTEETNYVEGSEPQQVGEAPNPTEGNNNQMNDQLSQITEGLSSLSNTVQGLQRQQEFDRQQSLLNFQSNQPVHQQQPEEINEIDLEGFSRKDFGDHMHKRAMSEMEKQLNSLKKEIKGISDSSVRHDMKYQVDQAKAKYDDFSDWEREMTELNAAQPSLTVNQLYSLVRSENRDKARNLDLKYNPPEPEAAPETLDMKDKHRLSFGGMRPQTAPGMQPESRMTSEEAVMASFEEDPSLRDFFGDR